MFAEKCKQSGSQSPQINVHGQVIISFYRKSYRYCAVHKILLWAETSWLSRDWSCHKGTGQTAVAVCMHVLKWNVWTVAQNEHVTMRYLRFLWWYHAYSVLGFDSVTMYWYQTTWHKLNTGRTSVCNKVFLVLDFIVHFSHYMFRPRLAAIFRWFANTKKYIQGSHYIFNGSDE
jgi:hypothetical protein